MANDVQDTEFFNVFDGTKGRPDGTYLDMQERIEAEKSRAIAEGRAPELENIGSLPGGTGTPMVPEERRVDNSSYSNPAIETLGSKTVDPVSTLGVDFGDADKDQDLSYAAMVANERQVADENLVEDPSSLSSASQENPQGTPVVVDETHPTPVEGDPNDDEVIV